MKDSEYILKQRNQKKKISENMMFILYGFSNNNMMDAFTNPSDILISGG